MEHCAQLVLCALIRVCGFPGTRRREGVCDVGGGHPLLASCEPLFEEFATPKDPPHRHRRRHQRPTRQVLVSRGFLGQEGTSLLFGHSMLLTLAYGTNPGIIWRFSHFRFNLAKICYISCHLWAFWSLSAHLVHFFGHF